MSLAQRPLLGACAELKIHIGATPVDLTQEDIEQMAQQTEGSRGGGGVRMCAEGGE